MEITKICNDCGKIFKGEICPKCGAHYKIEEKENNDPKFQNKKDNRNKINEDYGFTNEEIIKLYNTETKQADKVYKAFITWCFKNRKSKWKVSSITINKIRCSKSTK